MKRLAPAALALGVVAVAIALYSPMLNADFVYDSGAQVLVDDYIHHPRHLKDVFSLRVLSQDVLDHHRPAQLLSLMADSMLWGRNPRGYHLTNMLLHGATSGLLFLLLYTHLNRQSGLAALGALLFAVHPVLSEAVCEVSNREDLLVAFFILTGLLSAGAIQPQAKWRNVLAGAACVALLFGAVAAKEMGIVGPPLLLAYAWWFRRDRFQLVWWVVIGMSFIVVGAFLAARFVLQPGVSIYFTQPATYPGGSFVAMLKLQPLIWTLHLRNLVWPFSLCADYGPYSIRNFHLGLSLTVLTAVIAAQLYLGRRDRLAAFGALLFWLALLPVSNFLPIYRPAADRYLYLPMVGVAIWVLATARPALLKWRATWVVWLVACTVLALTTVRREAVWQNNLSLWRDTASRNPGSVTAANNLGYALFDAGRFDEAILAWQRALQLANGQLADAWAGLAIALDACGRAIEADKAFRRAVAIDDRYQSPDQLTKALVLDQRQATALKAVAQRNRLPLNPAALDQ